jgi:GTP-binding protein EngB required for normal cell division
LAQAVEQVTNLGTEFNAGRQKLQELHDRLAEERFHLAVLGQFKRGKSTLLNALLGEALLPTSVVPLTAIPTFLFPGSTLQARIVYRNGHGPETFNPRQPGELTTVLARFVTEEGNPHNQRNVAHVEVFHPAPLLRQGVVLIDTPGIGSTFRHNTEATLNFLPQCDAALFLVSADPPLTEVEVEFLQEVRAKVARLFFILNKVDYLNAAEQQAALSFLKTVLQEQVGLDNPEPIFCISARQGLEARQTDNLPLWERSGLVELEQHLLHFLVSDKTNVLQTALVGKAVDSLADMVMRLRLTIRSLQLPLAELDERRQLFAQKLAEAEQHRLTAQDLLAGDHKRLAALLEEQAEQLRRRARHHLGQIAQTAVARSGQETPDEQAVEDALAEAVPGFFERELGEMSRAFEPYWVTHQWRTSLSPFSPQLVDRFLPRRIQQARRWKRLQGQIESLVIQNVESLRWATRLNLDQAIRRFSSMLDERLEETGVATQGAIQAAYRQRQEQAGAVATIVARLETSAQGLEALQAKIQTVLDAGYG